MVEKAARYIRCQESVKIPLSPYKVYVVGIAIFSKLGNLDTGRMKNEKRQI